MNYDMKELGDRIKNLRERFWTSTVLLLFLISLSVAIAVIFPETTVVFLCVSLAVILLIILIKSISKFHPTVLFRKEIRGVNIKEHEYVTLVQSHMRASRYLGFYKGRYNQTASAKGVRAMVYLKLENGNVTVIDGLTKAHIDIYEEGDELVIPEGSKYPVVTSRKMKKQPCPLCGTINTDKDTRCASCGLGILL